MNTLTSSDGEKTFFFFTFKQHPILQEAQKLTKKSLCNKDTYGLPASMNLSAKTAFWQVNSPTNGNLHQMIP
jgi:hypothetical protein